MDGSLHKDNSNYIDELDKLINILKDPVVWLEHSYQHKNFFEQYSRIFQSRGVYYIFNLISHSSDDRLDKK